MSKFYYQGRIQQENFLGASDVFLSSLFGKYQLMIFESLTFLLYGVVSLLLFLFPFGETGSIPFIQAKLLGVVLTGLGIINLITSSVLSRRGRYVKLMKYRSIFYIALGLLLFFLPKSLEIVFYRIIAVILLIIGLSNLMGQKGKGIFKKIVSIALVVSGLFFMFNSSENGYSNLAFYTLAIILSSLYFYKSLKFRKRLKSYEDEVKGFTDYTIE